MTDNQEPKQRRLTLGSSKLSLNKSTGQSSVTRSSVNSAKTIVEVKKSTSQSALSFNKVWSHQGSQSTESTASEEFNRRLAVLKNAAAEKARAKNSDKIIPRLSEISRMNSIPVEEKIEEEIIEDIADDRSCRGC